MDFSLKIVLHANLPKLVYFILTCSVKDTQNSTMQCQLTLARVSVHYSNCVSPHIFYLYVCFFAEDLEAPTPLEKVHFGHYSYLLQKGLSIT